MSYESRLTVYMLTPLPRRIPFDKYHLFDLGSKNLQFQFMSSFMLLNMVGRNIQNHYRLIMINQNF
jgi:hypothetical protein